MSPENVKLEQLSPLLQEATIADKGKLTKPHTNLKDLLPKKTITNNDKKTVLLLGSGMVAAPLVEHLSKRKDTNIVIASNVLEEAKTLSAGHNNVECVFLDISDHNHLNDLISKSTVVVR